MKYVAEKEAENFLKKQGFDVVQTYFCKSKPCVLEASKKTGFPCVIKIYGKNVVHKNKVNGVKMNINNERELIKEFNKMKKMKGVSGVVLQEQIYGKEFILGIKYTEDFGHVIAFGLGGVMVEKIGKVSFRVPPLNEIEIENLITSLGVRLHKKEKRLIAKNIEKLCRLVPKFPKISELDINPLMVNKHYAFVVDARMVLK